MTHHRDMSHTTGTACPRNTQNSAARVPAQPLPRPAAPPASPRASQGDFMDIGRRDEVPRQKFPEQEWGAQSGVRLPPGAESERGLLFGGLF